MSDVRSGENVTLKGHFKDRCILILFQIFKKYRWAGVLLPLHCFHIQSSLFFLKLSALYLMLGVLQYKIVDITVMSSEVFLPEQVKKVPLFKTPNEFSELN